MSVEAYRAAKIEKLRELLTRSDQVKDGQLIDDCRAIVRLWGDCRLEQTQDYYNLVGIESQIEHILTGSVLQAHSAPFKQDMLVETKRVASLHNEAYRKACFAIQSLL